MGGYRYIEKLVCEFHYDDATRLLHYKDLKYTCLVVFNEVVAGIRGVGRSCYKGAGVLQLILGVLSIQDWYESE
jgi:hypothetical protein